MPTVELNRDLAPNAASPSPEKRTGYRGRFRDYVIFAFCACLYILPFMRLYLGGGDEGTLLQGAVRVAHGQVFARDFFEVVGPGTFYWLAAFFKVFGVSMLATRICLFITSLGTALLMYFLSHRVCRRYQALPCILLAGVVFGSVWPMINHHTDSNFFALLAVGCIALWLDRRSKGLLLAAGILTGLTTVFLQPKGILLFSAIAAWLWIQQRRRTTSLSSLGWLAGGYVAVCGLILLYFWSKGAFGSLIDANVVWPSRHYGAANSVPYAQNMFSANWLHWTSSASGFRWTFPISAVLIVPFLFVAALPGLLVVFGAHTRWNLANPEILLYWLCGAAMWLAEIHRMDIAHLVYGSPLLAILAIHFLTGYVGKIAGLTLQVLWISTVCLVFFQMSCLFLGTHTMLTRVGSVKIFKDSPALSFIEEHAAIGEEIFVYPYSPQYYFLSATTNPTPYSILVYDYNTPSQFHEVVRILDQHKVRYVVWNIDFMQKNAFSTSERPPLGGLIIEPYLESHYNVVWDDNDVRIMERKGNVDAN